MVLVLALFEVATLVLSWRRNQRLMAAPCRRRRTPRATPTSCSPGIETLKASGAEHRAVDRWGGLFIDQVNIDLSRGRLTAAVEPS